MLKVAIIFPTFFSTRSPKARGGYFINFGIFVSGGLRALLAKESRIGFVNRWYCVYSLPLC